MVCGNCAREIQGERLTCLYCGWSKTEGLSAPTAAQPLPGSREARTFRAGATTWRFLAWAIVSTAAGAILLRHRSGWFSGRAPDPLIVLAVALFVLGPLAFLAQLLRVALLKVTVDPAWGIRTSGRQAAWEEIQSVELAGARLGIDQSLLHFLVGLIRSFGFIGAGLLSIVRIFFIGALGLLILLVVLLSGICLPVFLLLSPWHPRVIVHLKDGRTLIWRDLTKEMDFVHCIEAGMRGREQTLPDDIS